MSSLDYQCDNGHIFERTRGRDFEKCPECGLRSPIIWLSPRSPHRQLQIPIIMWMYSDGSLGVAGGADSKTPKGAERVEIRSIGEYRKHAKKLNDQLKSKEEQREERYAEAMERMDKHHRSNLAWKMSQETDPIARDIYREALERDNGSRRQPQFKDFFSMVMEMDRSNYE